MPWEQIVIIGTGPLACDCVAIARKTTERVTCIEPEQRPMSRLAAICRASGVEYRNETDRAALRQFFETIETPTLVVSAYNIYIFPRTVVENPNLLLVNFHTSLLPRHPGRNAPTWAIFAEDAETGVTWHLVQSSVDAGDILMQAAMAIPPLVTGIELTRQTLELGARTFEQLLPRLWKGDYETRPQPAETRSALRKSTDVPNSGILDLAWDPHRISALLRSVDYGGLPVFPPLKLTPPAGGYRVARYTVAADATASPKMTPKMTIEPPIIEIQGDGLAIRMVLDRDDPQETR